MTSFPSPAAGVARRPRRLLSVVVALMVMASLVGACGATSTTSSPASSAVTAAAGSTVVGACPTSNTTAFAKTKFVAHAALAFGAFHRYLYEPYKEHDFAHFHHGRIVALLKAAAAAVFIKHEVTLAAADVRDNPTLCRAIAAPLRSFYSAITGLGSSIEGGGTSGIAPAQTSLASVISSSGGQGVAIVPDNNASIT